MTFLNPLLLLGLAAATVPVVLHLLNLRKLKTVEFSSLRFLRELHKTDMRRLKLRQWILLLLRTLLIVFLVLGFSRPALRVAGMFGGQSTSTLIIVLDDSPSMSVRNERGVLFAQAREIAGRIAGMAREGDNLYLLRLSDIRRRDTFAPLHSTEALKHALDESVVSQSTIPISGICKAVQRIYASSASANRELFLISDNQATQFSVSGRDSSARLGEQVHVFTVAVADRGEENLGVSSAGIETRILAQGKPLRIKSMVNNYGERLVHNSVVSVYLDGARVAQQSMDIGARAASTMEASVVPKRRGILQGYIQLEDDAFDLDNKRHFVVDIPEEIQILVVGADRQQYRMPLLALTAGADTTEKSVFRTHAIAENALSSTDIMKFDLLLMCGVKQFTDAEAERIVRFVKAGGGLVIFPGSSSVISNYNAALHLLGIPPLETPDPAATSSTSFLSFGAVDFAHPVFAGLFEQKRPGIQRTPSIDSPHILKTARPSPGALGQTIISLSDGSGFLVEYPCAEGRILLFAVSPDLSWSDFPMKGIFVPLLYRSCLYLASHSFDSTAFTVGDRLSFAERLGDSKRSGTYRVKSPSGIDETIVPHFSTVTGLAVFESEPSSEVGVYTLERTANSSRPDSLDILAAASVHASAAESDLQRATGEQLRVFWSTLGADADHIHEVLPSDELQERVQQSRFGMELWKHCLALALACACAEILLGRVPKGSVPDES